MAEESLGKAVAKEAAFGAIKAFASHAVKVWIIPLGLPAVTAYLGYLQDLPWMYIVVGAGIMFAAVTTGLVRFDDWRERKRIEGKLRYCQLRVLIATNVNGFCLGIDLRNDSGVPIEVDFAEIRTSLEDKVPKLKEYKKTRYSVAPSSNVFFDDHPIEIAAPKGAALEAHVDFRVKYGPVGNPKFSLSVKKRAHLPFDQNGAPRGNPAVYEAA